MQELNQPTPEEIAAMRQFSGENEVSGGGLPPFIGFNGQPKQTDSGHFSIKKEGQVTDLGTTIDAVIIKVRQAAQTAMNDAQNLYTDEYDKRGEVINLYNRNTRKRVGNGTYEELKEQCSNAGLNLKFSHILYLWSPKSGETYRLQVGGGSVSNLWTYLGQFGKNDTVFRYLTKFSSQEAISQTTKQPFIQMTFEKVGLFDDWKVVFGEVQALNSLLGSPTEGKAQLIAPQEEELPVIEEEPLPDSPADSNSDDDEIKVENIPF